MSRFRQGVGGYHPRRKLSIAWAGIRHAVILDFSVAYKLVIAVLFLTIAGATESILHFLVLLVVTALMLVAERMAALPEHRRRAARTLSKSRDAHADVLAKTAEDAVVLSIPGAESVQSWRAGVYARETQTLYKRVREADEQESFLYALPKRGMWLVGSTPGSTVGGLVAYDEVRDARKLNCAWHVFDGRTWAPARGVAVTVAKGRG